MIRKEAVIFITGASKGMGLEITKEALSRNYNVVATARKPELLQQIFGERKNLLTAKLDLNNADDIKSSVQAAVDKFGRIDVLINNAGYAVLGYFEETSEKLIREQFETNFFGTLNLTREILPIMRKQRSGFVVTTTSTSGIKAVEGDGIYAATKFALEGWMEGLNFEVTPYGIKCMILEPGAFRTNFFKEGSSFKFTDIEIDDYAGRREKLYKHFIEWDGKQDGDPKKLARNLINVLEHDNPPFRLLLSKSAYPAVDEYYTKRYKEFQSWHDVTVDNAFDE